MTQEEFNRYLSEAQSGDVTAQFNVGCAYMLGEGVEKDLVQAVFWYNKAAEQGDPDAQNSLGVCYAKGLGTQPSIAKGIDWFAKAARQGHVQAYRNLQAMKAELKKGKPAEREAKRKEEQGELTFLQKLSRLFFEQ